MPGDEYYIKLLNSDGKIIWENYIWTGETNTNDCTDRAFTELIKYYLPQEKFKKETSIMKVYAITPSVGDLIKLREIDVTKYRKNTSVSTDVSGVKNDNGKPIVGDMLRVFSNSLMAIGECMTCNAEAHPEPDDWKKIDNAFRRLTNAMIRHLLKYMAGKELDEDDNIPHLVHVAWNALAICELYLEKNNE